MSKVRFIGCLHLGHGNIAKRRGFIDHIYHDDKLIENWNKVVNKRDIIYILGDLTMETPEYYYILDLLKGTKRVVLGNHDRPQDVPELLNYVESVAGMVKYKGHFLTHAPIHPSEVGFTRTNIHAHIHHNKLHNILVPRCYGESETGDKPISTIHKYINVDAERMGYAPRTLEELLNRNYNEELNDWEYEWTNN